MQELETFSSLNESIIPFIQQVSDLLHTSIKENENVDIKKINLPNINEELDEFLADNPLYTSYSKNNISDFVFKKFVSRIFMKDGQNNQTHVILDYIHSWLERKLALSIVKDSRFNSLEVLKLLIDKTEMLRSFHIDLLENIPKEWVIKNKEDWTSVKVSPDKLLDPIRTYDREFINQYEITLLELPMENIWKYVQEATKNSDNIMLNHEFNFLSSVLIRTDIFLWIEFWDNLNLPIIQDCVFFSLFDFPPDVYLQLVSTLTDKEVFIKSNLKVLLLILAHNYFEASNKLTQRFSIYEDFERKNERNAYIFEKGIEKQKEWLEERKINYEILIQKLNVKLSNSEVEEWIFSYKPRTNNRRFKLDTIYNSEIELLTETYKKKSTNRLSFDLESFNLQKFNFYVKVIKENENKEVSSALLEAMTIFVSSERFFWDRTFSEPYWSALKDLGFVISQQENPIQIAKELIIKFKSIHQGWNPFKIDYSPIMKESFICSGVALLFENESAFRDKNEKAFFFKELLNHILMQDRFSQIDSSEYYQVPLRLLFLVANQLFPDVKEFCEITLIDDYDHFYSLLAILTIDKIPLLEISKDRFKARIESDFLLLKRQLKNRNQMDKIQELEKMIESLEIDRSDGKAN
ncbi:hypothetical protein LEP1GSC017_0003 [Leptospira meyeri serovar Hardjo str. Went 5]|uniref:hypothetical protein n=1 Tax=Leptospira meyeri TaxID=29508 RepID=UPI00028EDA62|nr:hypothetical protein [Leptospira meyeri]EKJ86150.1 hypothetical protein LEP1GSC017_0003 [Leptospira meyeri serovar Hardjo str. Went 5]